MQEGARYGGAPSSCIGNVRGIPKSGKSSNSTEFSDYNHQIRPKLAIISEKDLYLQKLPAHDTKNS